MVTQSDRLDDFSSISFWLIPPGLHAGGPQEFPSASPAVTTPGHLGASRGACLACEAVVSREYRDAHLTLWSALYVRTGASSRPRARHDDRVYPILSLVHHGLASEARSTACALGGRAWAAAGIAAQVFDDELSRVAY
jgi:hypothetical protein